jgi:predicted phosphodiesterase
MIFLTGDTHGEMTRFSSDNFPEGKKLTKNDYVIILGDFGLYWNNSKEEHYWKKWLNEKQWTTLWVDGNHENFPLIKDKTKEVEMFNGKVDVDKEYESIIHLKRGEVYTIENKTFFVMGGGFSVDKLQRIEHVSWWSEEMPIYEEYENALNNLDKYNWEIDYILTHTIPMKILIDLVREKLIPPLKYVDGERQLNHFLEEIYNKAIFKKWFHGHFHVNYEKEHICGLYETIINLED